MTTIPVPALLILCIACYTSSSFFAKCYSSAYKGNSASATPVYSSIFGLIVGTIVLTLGSGMRFSASLATWLYGLAAGIILFLFNLGSINASRTGSYALQSIFKCSGTVVVPTLFTVLFWGDRLLPHQFIGILIMLAAFVVINSKGLGGAQMSRRFLFWVVLLFVTNGVFGILMDAQQRALQQTERSEMIIITYYCAALISIAYLFLTRKKETLNDFHMGKKALLFTLGASFVTSLAVYTMMTLLGKMTTSIFFTLQNGLVLTLSVLLGAFVLREKPDRGTIIGVLLSLVSIILLTI